jgi:hypothetical protein
MRDDGGTGRERGYVMAQYVVDPTQVAAAGAAVHGLAAELEIAGRDAGPSGSDAAAGMGGSLTAGTLAGWRSALVETVDDAVEAIDGFSRSLLAAARRYAEAEGTAQQLFTPGAGPWTVRVGKPGQR